MLFIINMYNHLVAAIDKIEFFRNSEIYHFLELWPIKIIGRDFLTSFYIICQL